MRPFTQIVYLPKFANSDSPARINYFTGKLTINKSVFSKLSKEHRIYVLLHELGHYNLFSDCEFSADDFAHYYFNQMGYSINDKMINEIANVLDMENEQNIQRLQKHIARLNQDQIAAYAGEPLTNQEIEQRAITECDGMLGLTDSDYEDEVAALQAQFDMIKDFNECASMKGKLRTNRCNKKRNNSLNDARKALNKAISVRNSKRAMKNERRKGKTYKNCFRTVGRALKKQGKGSQNASKGRADMILAEQGIDSQANRRAATMDGITGIVDSIAGIFGGGPLGGPNGNPMAIILIVLAVGAAAYYFMNRKGQGNASSTS
jgi:hypothetical protein